MASNDNTLKSLRVVIACVPLLLFAGCGGGSGGTSGASSASSTSSTSSTSSSSSTSSASVTSSSSASYDITAQAGTGGSISPASMTVIAGSTAQFVVTPSSGYSLSSVTGCTGTLSGTTYTTGAIDSPCTVMANFVSHYTVTAAAQGGNIYPSSIQVKPGATTQFTLTPNPGNAISSVTGCGGTLSGNTFTTAAVTSDCSVIAIFKPNFEVTTVAGPGGRISPASTTVTQGSSVQFTVTASSGYVLGSVTGCGGTLSGSTYTTGAIIDACTVSASFANPSQSTDATAFQLDPPHDGAVTFAAMSFPSAPTWSFSVSGTPSYALIADGSVFITVQLSTSTPPTYSSELLALNQKTGAIVWGPIALAGQAGAAYDNGRVFVLTSASMTGTMEAYNANTGHLEWSTLLTGQTSFQAAPTALNGLVYATGSGSGGTVYAINESTGTVAWTGSLLDGGAIDPAVTATGVYTAEDCEAVDFLPLTGQVVWHAGPGCGSGGASSPVVANSLVYWSTNGAYSGQTLDAATGKAVGTFSGDYPPAITGTMGYFIQSSTLQGISTSNNIMWSFSGDGSLTGAPVAVNQYVIIGSSAGNLFAVDGTTGEQVWTQSLGAGIDANVANLPMSGLSAGDGLLVVPAGDKVLAYTLSENP